MDICEIEENGNFFLIKDVFGEVYAQRREMIGTLESPLTPKESVIIALCEFNIKKES